MKPNFRTKFEEELWRVHRRKYGVGLPNLIEYRKLNRADKQRIRRITRQLQSNKPMTRDNAVLKSFTVMRNSGVQTVNKRLKMENLYANAREFSNLQSARDYEESLETGKSAPTTFKSKKLQGTDKDRQRIFAKRLSSFLRKASKAMQAVPNVLLKESTQEFIVYEKGDYIIVANPAGFAKNGSPNGLLVGIFQQTIEHVERDLQKKGYIVRRGQVYK